jgi:3-oxoacyl-[acyl-carrier protein] reductase
MRMTDAQWDDVLNVNLRGAFICSRAAARAMVRARYGRIVNVSSVVGLIGNPGQANYAAAKAGLHGASKSLALELASRGVTVNVVAPGIIESGMSRAVFDSDAIKRLVPMKRAGTPQEVAALVAFLASDDAGYVSAQVIGLNGAMA